MKDPIKKPLNDDAISQLLRELPRQAASDQFLARTLKAARQKPKKNRFRLYTFAVATAGVFLGMLWFTSPNILPTPDSEPIHTADTSIQSDLAELEKMAQEIRRLQALSESKTPMIRVRSESQKEYFIDMRSVANATAEKTYAHFRPTRHF